MYTVSFFIFFFLGSLPLVQQGLFAKSLGSLQRPQQLPLSLCCRREPYNTHRMHLILLKFILTSRNVNLPCFAIYSKRSVQMPMISFHQARTHALGLCRCLLGIAGAFRKQGIRRNLQLHCHLIPQGQKNTIAVFAQITKKLYKKATQKKEKTKNKKRNENTPYVFTHRQNYSTHTVTRKQIRFLEVNLIFLHPSSIFEKRCDPSSSLKHTFQAVNIFCSLLVGLRFHRAHSRLQIQNGCFLSALKLITIKHAPSTQPSLSFIFLNGPLLVHPIF